MARNNDRLLSLIMEYLSVSICRFKRQISYISAYQTAKALDFTGFSAVLIYSFSYCFY